MNGNKRKQAERSRKPRTVGLEAVYTLEEAAQYTQLSTRTLRTYIRAGRLEAKRVGREYRIRQSALASLVGVK